MEHFQSLVYYVDEEAISRANVWVLYYQVCQKHFAAFEVSLSNKAIQVLQTTPLVTKDHHRRN